MEELRDAPTRALAPFETRALAALNTGEDVVTEQPSADVLQMVGAIRAARQCLECHQVQRGALLGAFSYELRYR